MTRPPAELAVGETTEWTLELADFAPSDGWAVAYFFRGPTAVDLAGVPVGEAFEYAVIGSTFTTAGAFTWEAIATNAGTAERCRVGSGRLTVVPNLEALAAPSDQTSFAEKMLEALEAALLGTATKAQRSYTIAGRSIERIEIAELERLRDRYARKVAGELELSAHGLTKAPRRVAVRLN